MNEPSSSVTSTIKPACYVFLFICTIKTSKKKKDIMWNHMKQTSEQLIENYLN